MYKAEMIQKLINDAKGDIEFYENKLQEARYKFLLYSGELDALNNE
jgi:hypothetical protein